MSHMLKQTEIDHRPKFSKNFIRLLEQKITVTLLGTFLRYDNPFKKKLIEGLSEN